MGCYIVDNAHIDQGQAHLKLGDKTIWLTQQRFEYLQLVLTRLRRRNRTGFHAIVPRVLKVWVARSSAL